MKMAAVACMIGLTVSIVPARAQSRGGDTTGATLDRANALIGQQRYDDAIPLLRALADQQPANGDVAIALARAYHWKKDYPNAKRWYAQAGHLDGRYRLDIVGLLDDLGESEEIVTLAEPAFNGGNRTPSLLGSLMTADEKLGRKDAATTVLAALANANYTSTGDRDYRNYILAYHALSQGDQAACLSYLGQISSRAMRAYARTSDKFAKLRGNPEFEKITQ